MNYAKAQIKRITRNRMILFGILAAYFSMPLLVGLASPQELGEGGLFIMVVIMFALPCALFVFFFACALNSYRNYTVSRQYKRFAANGQGSAEELNVMVSRELETAQVYSYKRLRLTRS